MKLLSSNKKNIIFIIGLPLVLYFMCLMFYKLGPDWRYYTSPITNDTKEDLCVKFVDSNNIEKICGDEHETYGPDFYQYVENVLLPPNDIGLDNEAVQTLLEPYLIICETYPEKSEFGGVCHYDLRGDRVYPFIVYFDKNNNVDSLKMRLQTPP